MAVTFTDATPEKIKVRIAGIGAEIKARKRRTKFIFAAGVLVIAFGILIMYVSAQASSPTQDTKSVGAFGLLVVILSAFGIGASLFSAQVAESALDQELAMLNVKDSLVAPRALEPGEVPGSSSVYFDRLVDINLTNLSAYYGLVKIHASNGFLLATSAGAVGFALLIFGLLLGYFGDPTTTRDISYLAAASGVLTEFISGVFFYLYSKTVTQLKEYHDSLLAVQNILLSFKLVGDTENPEQKAAMVSQMVQYLVGKNIEVKN